MGQLKHTTNFFLACLLGTTNTMDITKQGYLKLIDFIKLCLEVKAIKKMENLSEMIIIKTL